MNSAGYGTWSVCLCLTLFWYLVWHLRLRPTRWRIIGMSDTSGFRPTRILCLTMTAFERYASCVMTDRARVPARKRVSVRIPNRTGYKIIAVRVFLLYSVTRPLQVVFRFLVRAFPCGRAGLLIMSLLRNDNTADKDRKKEPWIR